MNSFSSRNRDPIIEQLGNKSFDLLVIGGGITGAGIALDASARGLKVALIEMQDFASGTSGRSTKLIHGGLRYLKQFEFKLVAEVGKERKIVHENARHLVRPEQMLLPIVKNGSLGKLSARLAIFVYEWIARVRREERHRVMTTEQTLNTEPALKKDDLLSGILFYEYRTDDARLTMEVMKEAVSRGLVACNYIEAVSFIYQDRKIRGVTVKDKIHGKEYKISAKYIVNAGGPWVDAIDDMDEKRNKHKLHITKGVHVVFDWKRLPVKQSAYFDTYDGRMLFVIPREGKTYAGTTDTFYHGDMVNPKITNEDRNYILRCVNEYFPGLNLVSSDIESGWAGLRPLVNKPGKGPSEISRKDEIFQTASGLITIAGGKLTGYRKMAERTVNLVANKLQEDEKKRLPSSETARIQLSGGKFKSDEDFTEFVNINTARGGEIGLSAAEATTLVYRYGTNVHEVYQIYSELSKKANNELPLFLKAQLIYCIEKEMCVTPADFFIRRTGSLYFDIGLVKKYNDLVASHMRELFGWDATLTQRLSRELEQALDDIEAIKK
jgi:glycerol-3-phosphate dehydrogenase